MAGVNLLIMETMELQAQVPIKPETASGVVKIVTVSHRGFAANDARVHRGCSECSYDVASERIDYNYFRYYDSSTGRYTTSDPRGVLLDFSDPSRQIAAQMGAPIPRVTSFNGLNHTYGYANRNPLMYTDPTGEFTPIAGAVGGFVAGSVGTFVGSYFIAGQSFEDSLSNAFTGGLYGLTAGFIAGFGGIGIPVGIGLDLLLNGSTGASASEIDCPR
jgi:hypothetical protein